MQIEWPTAGVIIAALLTFAGAIIAAIIKWMPARVQTVVNGHGERLAKVVEVVDLRARVATLERDVTVESKYTHKSLHDIRDILNMMKLDQALMKQNVENLCDRLQVNRPGGKGSLEERNKP